MVHSMWCYSRAFFSIVKKIGKIKGLGPKTFIAPSLWFVLRYNFSVIAIWQFKCKSFCHTSLQKLVVLEKRKSSMREIIENWKSDNSWQENNWNCCIRTVMGKKIKHFSRKYSNIKFTMQYCGSWIWK